MNSHFNCLICGAMVVLQSIASAAQTAPATPQPAVSSVPQKQGWHPVDISQISFSQLAEEQIIESLSKDLNISSQQAEELLKGIEIHQWFGLPRDMGDDSPLPMMMVSFRWKDEPLISPKPLAVACILRERERHYRYLTPTSDKVRSFAEIYEKMLIPVREIKQYRQLAQEWSNILYAPLPPLGSLPKNGTLPRSHRFDGFYPLIQAARILGSYAGQKRTDALRMLLDAGNTHSPYVAAANFDHNNNTYRLDIVFLPFIR